MRSKLLSDAQILYPSIAANHSVYLGTIFLDKAPPSLLMHEPDATDESSVAHLQEKFRASLEADLADPNWHTLVISAENLWNFDPKSTTRFIEWLTEFVSNISVVAYVRHPVDWTRSVVQQRLKGGQTLNRIYEDVGSPPWQQQFTPWLDAVGLEQFRLISFDDARENEGIMASFCDVAGLPRETVLPLAPPIVANESMSLEAILLLDSLNRQQPLFIDGKLSPERRRYAKRYGIGALQSVPGNRLYLSAEHMEKARVDSRPDLEWLNATFGKNLFPDVFEDSPIETPIRPNTMPQETVDALAAMFSDLFGKEARAKDKQAQVKDLQRRLKHRKDQLELARQTNSTLRKQLEQERRPWWEKWFSTCS